MLNARMSYVGLTVAAVLVLGACASGGVRPTNTAAANSAPGAAAETSPVEPPQHAHIGGAITVTGPGSTKLTVTLVKVFPDATGADEFSSPGPGKHLYAVQLRITNAGPGFYTDVPDDCAELLDASGHQIMTDAVAEVTVGPSFTAPVSLAPGGSAVGIETFQVPNNDTLEEVDYTPDAGMADTTARWNLS